MDRWWWLRLFGNTQARGEKGEGEVRREKFEIEEEGSGRLVEFLQGVTQAGEKGIFRIC